MGLEQESIVLQAVEESISHANAGLSPNAAIQKVAEQRQLGPEYIRRMVEAYNKSKAVHFLKTAAPAERGRSFELADAGVVIRAIYAPPVEKTASEALPTADFSKSDFLFEKVAEAAPPKSTLTAASYFRKLEKYASVLVSIERKIKERLMDEKSAFHKALEKAAEEIQPMTDAQFKKAAQLIVNGYPADGDKLVRLLAAKALREVPSMGKTAHQAVFPHKEPFIAVSQICEHAEKMARLENQLEKFYKESQFMPLVKGLSSAHSKGNLQRLLAVGSFVAPEDSAKRELREETSNMLQELEAKRNFMDLVLYDKDLKNYKHRELVDAYNSVVQIVPDSYRKPALLKQLMMRHLESGGVRDIFELSKEVELEKNLVDIESKVLRMELDRDKEERDSKKKDVGKFPLEAELEPYKGEKGEKGFYGTTFSTVGEIISGKKEKEKDRGESSSNRSRRDD
jgi:hypothetical protein